MSGARATEGIQHNILGLAGILDRPASTSSTGFIVGADH